jgi:multidrug efflux pump subunit AcrB
MWIVRLAIDRPYTFVVVSILIALIGILTATRMAIDIFPSIDIPVVSVVWTFTGLAPEEMESRIMTVSERAMTTVTSDIEHMESVSLNGIGIARVYLHKGANVGQAVALMSAINQTVLRVMPPGITPPAVVAFSATDVPVMQLGVGSKTLTEAELYDYDLNFIRTRLATVGGAEVPLPYGGKARQVMVDLDPKLLLSKGISPNDVVNSLLLQNIILPAGVARLGTQEFPVRINGSPELLQSFNSIPIRQINNATTYMRDIGFVHDGYAIQTNIVKMDGKTGTLLAVLRAGGASTLAVVKGIVDTLPLLKKVLPKSLDISVVADQSLFVRAAIFQVVQEAVVAALLTGLLMLLLLGSWRSTLIVATSIPLSIMASIIGLGASGQTLNLMTLGGLSLAIGMLVDDATVEVENIHRNLDLRLPLKEAVLTSAAQVALPAFVSTLSICIVFVPVALLTEPSRSLFVPLGMGVVFAMMASYFLSRTLVPVMSVYLLKNEELPGAKLPEGMTAEEAARQQAAGGGLSAPAEDVDADESSKDRQPPKGWLAAVHTRIDRRFNGLRARYHSTQGQALDAPVATIIIFAIFYAISFCLIPFIGQDFFPQVDSGQMRLHLITPVGTRIEETEHYFSRVETAIRKFIPANEITHVTWNMGIPANGLSLAYGDNTNYTDFDGEMLIQLNPEHHGSTFVYQKQIRAMLVRQFPEVSYYFQPADITTQVLNAGLQAPIDIQVTGRQNREANYKLAQEIKREVSLIPGAVDVLVRQPLHEAQINVDVDRSRAIQLGLTQRDVSFSLITSLSSSFQTSPSFWVNPQNGVNYNVAVQTPLYKILSTEDIMRTLITGTSGVLFTGNQGPASFSAPMPQVTPGTVSSTNGLGVYRPTTTQNGVASLLMNLATTRRTSTSAFVSHYAIQPVFDVYANIADRDLGGVSHDVQNIIERYRKKVPEGTLIYMRGQADSMNKAFLGLFAGMAFALVLIYLLLVMNFQSWLDPLIILMAIPGALCGVIWALFLTQTTFSVPALMGAIMSIGVGAANSILMVNFANERFHSGDDPKSSASQAGFIRFRPVLMTAMAMVVGMLPMASGLGEGGGQNAPLGRAVIGGLVVATLSTLFFVPVVYSRLKRRKKVQPEK